MKRRDFITAAGLPGATGLKLAQGSASATTGTKSTLRSEPYYRELFKDADKQPSTIEKTLNKSMEYIVEGTAYSMRMLFKNQQGGHLSRMDNWTGRYHFTDKYHAMDVGYLLGRLWLLYLHTNRKEYRTWCVSLIQTLAPALTSGKLTSRPSGVDIYYGLCWGAQITGSRKMRDAAIQACDNLVAGLYYKEAGHGLFYSGAVGRHTNIDSLLALFAFPWVAKYKPEYIQYFTNHADTIIDTGLIREDGSTFQEAIFDENHKLKYLKTHQGWNTNSTWARGQAWAMHNFTAVYEATALQKYLDIALKVSNWWVDHVPEDYIPHYDFDDPERFSKPKDSCAAALAVLALVRLAKAKPELAAKYQSVIEGTFEQFLQNYITDSGLVIHGSWGNAVRRSRPLRWPQEDMMPYGNYYLVEALYRSLNRDWSIFELGKRQ